MPSNIKAVIKKHKLNTLIIIIILICLGILLAVNKYQDYQLAQISTFDECAQAGYPVLESYPPQCRTPDGRTFIGLIQQQECTEDTQCGNGYYCLLGACEPFIVDTSCTEDSDCTLINTKNRYSCCWTGQCENIDYSENTWIAVNESAFGASRNAVCPDTSKCGPSPLCDTKPDSSGLNAVCRQNVCVKK